MDEKNKRKNKKSGKVEKKKAAAPIVQKIEKAVEEVEKVEAIKEVQEPQETQKEEKVSPRGAFEWVEGNGWGEIKEEKSQKENPLPVLTEQKSWSERVVTLEKAFEKVHFHEIIMGMIGRRQISPALDFRNMSKVMAESTVQSLQDWVAMSRDLKATPHEVESVLRGCGFDVLEVVPERRHRISFTVTCEPILSGINLPQGYVTSASNGRFRIACYWGRPSEEMLLSELNENGEDDAVIIFHFGNLTDDRRYDLAKLCKADRQSLLVLDDIMVVYLFGLMEGRLSSFFASALPFSYEDQLLQDRRPSILPMV